MKNTIANAPVNGALVAVTTMVVVSPFAVARDWGADSWALAAGVCAVAGVTSAIVQAGRNRRLDASARQARAAGETA